MTLRSRLLIIVGGLLAVALVLTGVLVVGLTRQNLVDQVDSDLRAATDSPLSLDNGPGPDDPTGRRFALMIFDADGGQLRVAPSGIPSAPDPLPAVPGGGVRSMQIGQITELPAQQGPLRYRALPLRARFGPVPVIALLAAPMGGVEESVAVLVRALLIVGIIVLAIALVVGWFLIRRDLRPLEKVTATASRISGGDLSQRVGMSEHSSEVGRLGAAFDSMLDQIQLAFESQQRALNDKERTERQLRQFVADASHELRTPLTTLRGYTDLYRAGGLDEDAALEQAMLRINTESRRMADLVEDMLLLARLDQGRPLASELVSLSELVEDAVSDARAVEPDRMINAHIDSGMNVLGDADRLRQVVGNLFTNVRVHTPPTTPIDVNLSAYDGRCRLTVADHGPGVDPAHVAHIFDRFYRADQGRSRDRGGSGLGLSIAASVAEAHGGAIAYSETLGGGATFTVELPRAEAQALNG